MIQFDYYLFRLVKTTNQKYVFFLISWTRDSHKGFLFSPLSRWRLRRCGGNCRPDLEKMRFLAVSAYSKWANELENGHWLVVEPTHLKIYSSNWGVKSSPNRVNVKNISNHQRRWCFETSFIFTLASGKWSILTNMNWLGWFNHQPVTIFP